MKDYHDLVLLIRDQGMLDTNKLKVSLSNTFSHRGTDLSKIEFDKSALESIQKLWKGHLQGLGDIAQELKLPIDISTVIKEINSFITVAIEANSILTSR